VTGRNTNHYTITELESNVIVCNFQQFFVAPRCFPWPSAASPWPSAAPRGHSRLPAGGSPRLPASIRDHQRLPVATRVSSRLPTAVRGHPRLPATPRACPRPSRAPRHHPRLLTPPLHCNVLMGELTGTLLRVQRSWQISSTMYLSCEPSSYVPVYGEGMRSSDSESDYV
jgi:hypothetical protein